METYTKQQLVQAMTKYNEKVCTSPELFNNKSEWTANEKALNQIEYLIDNIETGEAK